MKTYILRTADFNFKVYMGFNGLLHGNPYQAKQYKTASNAKKALAQYNRNPYDKTLNVSVYSKEFVNGNNEYQAI